MSSRNLGIRILFGVLLFAHARAFAQLPANFQKETFIGSGLTFPTALEFLPDGSMLILEFSGRIWMAPPGSAQINPAPVLQITNIFQDNVALDAERGLTGIAIDPNFTANHFIYLFYTPSSPPRDRVSRFTLNGAVADPASEFVVWQAAGSSLPDHHGGWLAFGNDGKLYITTGDNGEPSTSQSLTSDHGKLLRVNSDGTVPTDNPFYDGAGPNVDTIWARGLRNPYRFSIDSVTGRIYIGDVGGNEWNSTEEINLGVRGANYGWPTCEGTCGVAGMTNPIYSHSHASRDSCITAGFVYRGTQFPSQYQGAYFFGDYVQNWIRYLTLDANGLPTAVNNFLPSNGTPDGPYGDPVSIRQGPDGALYYVDIGVDWTGQHPPAVIRIRYISQNQPPMVVSSANPTSGLPPLSVAFSSAGTSDPEGNPLSYAWTFGDGGTSTAANPTHVYQQAGAYIARLTVADSFNSTLGTPISIRVGRPPSPVIAAPASGSTFQAGSVISYSGSATDPDDGILPASAFSWTIFFHHDTHVHPGGGPFNGITAGTFTIPASGHDFAGNTSYEIVLTVTDSSGLTTSTSVFVNPQKVNLTFASVPSGLLLYVDGIPTATPFVKDSLVNFRHTIQAPGQASAGTQYAFTSWSDSGAQTHEITVPSTSGSITATFQATGPAPTGLVAAYGFNEGSGTSVFDSSGNGRSGVISGATWTTLGKFGNALSFDGVSNWVTVADAPALQLTTGMTLEAWIYSNTTTGTQDVLLKESPNADIYNLYARNWRNRPESNVFVGGTNRTAEGTALAINVWTHMAGTYDGAVLRLYINGVQAASTNIAGAITTSTGALRIGGNSMWGEYFRGLIDEVRIYNRALTQAEIQTDMNTPIGGLPADTTAPDRSNGAPTGTLPAGSTQTSLSLTTNENATCRYATSAGVAYASMLNTFTTTGGTAHSTTVTGLVNGGSYNFYVRCQDTAGNPNANDFAISFTVAQPSDTTPPVRSNGQPAGTLPTGTTQTTLSLVSNENATCRYATSAGVAYASMPTTFTATGGTAHSRTVTGLVNGGSYNFYVRCQDTAGNPNTNDFTVSFTVAQPSDTTPPVRSTGQPTGALPAGTTQTTLSLVTNENATCRYASAAGVAYASMPNTFTTTGGTAHSTTVTGLVDGGSYNFYVRCQDTPGNANPNDFTVSFTVAQTAPSALVAAYGFNEGTGTSLADASGNGRNGVASGATWTTQGKFGNALSFDGVNDWVTVADAPALRLTTGMTIEAWVYPTTTTGTRDILIKEGSNVDIYNLYSRNWRGRPESNVLVSGSNRTAEGTALAANVWTHIAGTYDGAVLRLYINGVQAASTNIAGSITTSTGALRIGGNSMWAEFFLGRIDEVRIYNRALTQTEIQTDMNTPINP